MRVMVIFIGAVLLLAACGQPQQESEPPPPPTAVRTPPKVFTVIGDSFTSGTKAGGNGKNGWPSLVSVRLRQDGFDTAAKVDAEGGAGYITPGDKHHTFVQLAERSVQPNDNLVIYFGTLNDGADSGLDYLAATNAVNETFVRTRATAPHAKLLVIGPATPYSNPPPFAVTLNNILRDQAELVGGTFVDALAEKWLQNDPALVGPDHLQPNDAGHRYLADKIAPLVEAQLRAPA